MQYKGKVWYSISKNEERVHTKEGYGAEEILRGAIVKWPSESDIDGKTVDQENLAGLSKANIMAV